VHAIKHCLDCTVSNINDEEDHNSNHGYDNDHHAGVDDSSHLEPCLAFPEANIQLEEFDSSTPA
jgi:hypothetical protein